MTGAEKVNEKQQAKTIPLKAVLITLTGFRTGDVCWELRRVNDVGLPGHVQKDTYSITRIDGILSNGDLTSLYEEIKGERRDD